MGEVGAQLNTESLHRVRVMLAERFKNSSCFAPGYRRRQRLFAGEVMVQQCPSNTGFTSDAAHAGCHNTVLRKMNRRDLQDLFFPLRRSQTLTALPRLLSCFFRGFLYGFGVLSFVACVVFHISL